MIANVGQVCLACPLVSQNATTGEGFSRISFSRDGREACPALHRNNPFLPPDYEPQLNAAGSVRHAHSLRFRCKDPAWVQWETPGVMPSNCPALIADIILALAAMARKPSKILKARKPHSITRCSIPIITRPPGPLRRRSLNVPAIPC